MKDSTIIQAAKPIKWYNQKLDTNFKQLFKSLTKACVSYFLGSSAGAIKESVNVLDSLSLTEDVPGIAYHLIIKAFQRAAYDLAIENQYHFDLSYRDIAKINEEKQYVYFLERVDEILSDKELEINLETLSNPHRLPILSEICVFLNEWLQLLGFEQQDAKNLTNRFPAYFVLALNDEWKNNKVQYDLILQQLDTPFTQAASEELEWQHYFAFLKKQAEEPVFDDPFSLRQVYVPLRGYYIRSEGASPASNAKERKVPVLLEEELDRWVCTQRVDDCIRVISGGPGSGKSTLTKIWCAKLADRNQIKVLFIPLHFFDLQRDLVESVGEFIDRNVDVKISYNPLARNEKVLLVFDGLDEISQQGEYAADVARKFIQAIHRQNAYRNRDRSIKVLFLVTGRELIVQNNAAELRVKRQVVHLLPYKIKAEDLIEFDGGKKFLKEDQRKTWWQKYSELLDTKFDNIPIHVSGDYLREITAQPLLNYLVALSVKRGKIAITDATNMNEIYNDLIEGVYERAYEKGRGHKSIEGLTLNDFRRVLEEIAIAAWQGGDLRTTTVERIQQHVKRGGLQPLLDRFKNDAKTGITRLLTAFYFRQFGLEYNEQTFEFTHKSFGEYLTATRLVKLVGKIHEQLLQREIDYDTGWDEKRALRTWIEVAGEASIDFYLFQFIKNEIDGQTLGEVERWQNTLSSLLSWLFKYDMPVIKHDASINENWRLSRNAEEALMVLLNCCALKTQSISQISFPSQLTVGTWLAKLQPQRSGVDNTIGYSCLGHLDMDNQVLFNHDLDGAVFSYSSMRGVSLKNANLRDSRFNYVELDESNFDEANLRNSEFKEASLIKASFDRTTLYRANFFASKMYSVSMVEATFFETVFEKAVLTLACLERAKSYRGNYKFVMMKSVNAFDASFIGSEFYRANVDEAMLERARFRSSTIKETSFRASRLLRSSFRDAKITNTNFDDAYLSGTNLRGAELDKVSFRGATLVRAVFEQSTLQEVDFTDATGYTASELAEASTFYGCRGIPESIMEELRELRPEWF